MTAPNRNTLWARALVDELHAAGVTSVCIAPGSRSTPLTVAFADHDAVEVFSHLDERAAAFFALGRGKRTGEPTAVVCTSGTAAANFHPAVIEANQARVPLLVLTADRPPELRDSGANQTIDQEKLYGESVRWYKDLPEPEADDRKLRSLRTTACQAVAETTGVPPGPVHLNVPFCKPLEPVEVPGDVPTDFAEAHPLAAKGRAEKPYVDHDQGELTPNDTTLDRLADAVRNADRGLIVVGPDDCFGLSREALVALADATGFPVLADPLSDLRYGPHATELPVLGGYDAYLGADPFAVDVDCVLRFGASPTSKPLRHYLRDHADRQFVVDPAGEWREATFTATNLVAADPGPVAFGLATRVDRIPTWDWHDALEAAERTHWDLVVDAPDTLEGKFAAAAVAEAPDPATIFVSNSMPVRDVDRFGKPRDADLTVLGNRGASGIDGITSTALGSGSATEDSLVLLTGDLAYYHDMNGLLALDRADVDATIVLVNNDGGGIFHMLPIEDFDPPFTSQFKTPHGLDFAPTADLYGLEFASVEAFDDFRARYRESVTKAGTQVIEVCTDADVSHRVRDDLQQQLLEKIGG